MKGEDDVCFAGRKAFFGGRWKTICLRAGINVIGSESKGIGEIKLCEEHFQEVLKAGLVSEPYIDPDEYSRKYGTRD